MQVIGDGISHRNSFVEVDISNSVTELWLGNAAQSYGANLQCSIVAQKCDTELLRRMRDRITVQNCGAELGCRNAAQNRLKFFKYSPNKKKAVYILR